MILKSMPLIAAVTVLSGCGSHYNLHFDGRIGGQCVIFNQRTIITENHLFNPKVKFETQNYLIVQINENQIKTFWDNNDDLKVDEVTIRNADGTGPSYSIGALKQQEFDGYLKKIVVENEKYVPLITDIYGSYDSIGCPPDPYQ